MCFIVIGIEELSRAYKSSFLVSLSSICCSDVTPGLISRVLEMPISRSYVTTWLHRLQVTYQRQAGGHGQDAIIVYELRTYP
jgi:hypothetical protein